MRTPEKTPAAFTRPAAAVFALSGSWTALGAGSIDRQLELVKLSSATPLIIDGAAVAGLDTVGVCLLQRWFRRLREEGVPVQLRNWDPRHSRLIELVAEHADAAPRRAPKTSAVERFGRAIAAGSEEGKALFAFIGESALAFASGVAHPGRVRWRPILHNIRSAGVDALPIISLLSFLLGIVIAYQGADQLRRYGANIFVADLVGVSMLREFAPLITAIIVAGRSGSAYAAQIGTMAVTEEIDAMRTLGIAPLELLVLPKILALIVVVPLLTFVADVVGVFGGMIMARSQLDVGFEDFIERFVKAVSVTAYMVGISKAPVFAAIIALVGCFQGFRSQGGADSVGRQTTRSVVQSIFLVIVADALFSVTFSVLDL